MESAGNVWKHDIKDRGVRRQLRIGLRLKTHVFIFIGGGGGGGGGSEPLPYFREIRTPETYHILGKSHNPGHPMRSWHSKKTYPPPPPPASMVTVKNFMSIM